MSETCEISRRKTIGLLLVGGRHHILHLIPIAAELEKHEDFSVIIFVTSVAEHQACNAVLEALGAKQTQIQVLEPRLIGKRLSPKLSFLLRHMKLWKGLDALILAERTSTILRYFSRRLPPLIHIPHGAGDRAKSYDARIKHFDHVLVAGPKDKRRMMDLGLVSDNSCHVTGYIKPFAVRRMCNARPAIFETERPVALYNPHFSSSLSSWPHFGLELLEAFAKRTDMNFIFAPHVRLFSKGKASDIAQIMAFAKYDNIHIDLGSERSTDMTYTRAADIYIGDVSSQVYEFLLEPKPCIFITPADTQWKGNPDYAHWDYGPVCYTAEEVMSALSRAEDSLSDYAQSQSEGCLAAKGDPAWNPIERAAAAVRSILS